MPDILIENLYSGRHISLRLSGKKPNFRLQSDRISAAALHDLEPSALDFLEIAAAVFYADSEFPRGGDTRPDMGSNWRRKLRITIPVRMQDLWRRQDVGQCLTDAVRFMTDDEVEFIFGGYRPDAGSEAFLDLDPAGVAFRADEVILFSGGLDSFAGALETLSKGPGKILLVSHRSAPKVFHRQDELAAWLMKRFPGRVRHVKVGATRKGQESHDTTQRSRSLLFAAIGHAVAQAFGSKHLSFFENGIVSHNLPISQQVVTTMATRTTHPRTIDLLNRLLALISPDSTQLTNAYAWMTKLEVVERISHFDGTAMISTAVSCTHVRDQTTLHTHCGACSQCLDRRFAILAAGLETHDPGESYLTNVLFGARDSEASRTLAVEWTRHALQMRHMSDEAFMQTFGMELFNALQVWPEEERESQFRNILAMHRRHAETVEKVLVETIQTLAPEFVRNGIEPTSLVLLHLGTKKPADFNPRNASFLALEPPISLLSESEDFVPDPNGPWTARFLIDGHHHAVVVDHLGRVDGAPALMAHLLKDVLLEERIGKVSLENHKFVHLPTLTPISKEAAKTNVSRFRKALSQAYTDIFGMPPQRHLLIESKGKQGHRLDPLTRVVDKT